MPAIEISEELAQQIEQGAQQSGKTRDRFLLEAVLSRLEDLEDITTVAERLNKPGERIPLEQVKRNLGLED